jgi:long-subunit fatty acid transport protein
VEPNFAVNYSVGNLKLTPKLYYDVVLKGPTYEFNAAYTVPLKDWGTELDFAGTVGSYYQDDAVNGSVPKTHAYGDYWLLGVSAPYQLTKDLKLTVGWAYTQGSNAYTKQNGQKKVKNTEAIGKGVVSVGLTYSW